MYTSVGYFDFPSSILYYHKNTNKTLKIRIIQILSKSVIKLKNLALMVVISLLSVIIHIGQYIEPQRTKYEGTQ